MSKCWLPQGKSECSLEDARFWEIWLWVVLCYARSAPSGGPTTGGPLHRLLLQGPFTWWSALLGGGLRRLLKLTTIWGVYFAHRILVILVPMNLGRGWMLCSWRVSILLSKMQGISTSLLPKQMSNQATKASIPSSKVLLAPSLVLELLIKLIIHEF